MNTQRFIARQQVKYYWKVITNNPRSTVVDAPTTGQIEPFMHYEKTPRVIV